MTKDRNPSLLDVAHEMAQGLYKAGIINGIKLREYELLCISPVRELSPSQIKRIRLHEKISQSVFAKYLNTSPSTVSQGKQGEKHPRGTSLKLLNLVANKGIEILT